jgi:hypothetical protein
MVFLAHRSKFWSTYHVNITLSTWLFFSIFLKQSASF